MNSIQAAICARVSSEQQADAQTIANQVAALHARVAAEGLVLPSERQFIDEGYSGGRRTACGTSSSASWRKS